MITNPLRFKMFSWIGLFTAMFYFGIIAVCINLARLSMNTGSTMQRILNQGLIYDLLIETLAFSCFAIICWTVKHWLQRRGSHSLEREVRSELAGIKKEVADLKVET